MAFYMRSVCLLAGFWTFIVCNGESTTTTTRSGEWSEWSDCSVSCGVGEQTRNRSCEGCTETRRCRNDPCLHDATLMVGVVLGVSAVLILSLVVALVCIFFFKEKSEKKIARKSSAAEWSTPAMSRRTVDSSADFKLSLVMRRDQGPDSLRIKAPT